MANDYKPLSTIVLEAFEIAGHVADSYSVRVTRPFITALVERIVELETALAVSNNTVKILKGEMTFDSEDDLTNYIREVNGEEAMFTEIGQPVVKPIDTALGGTDNTTLPDSARAD